MARNRRRNRQQRPIKGFRPGREPPELRKRQAKKQFADLSPSQERLMDLFAERSPEEARALVRRWELGIMAAAIVAAILAAVLLFWSVVATVIVGVLAVVLLALWWRLRGQREAFHSMADAVAGKGRRRSGGR